MAGQRVMPDPRPPRSFVRRRPGVTVAAGGGVTAIVLALLARDYPTAAVSAVSVVPAGIAFVVDQGGVRGLLERVWRGN